MTNLAGLYLNDNNEFNNNNGGLGGALSINCIVILWMYF